MSFKLLTLSASAVYLTGVLVGYQIEPEFGLSLQDNSLLTSTLHQAKPELLWSIAGNNISVALINRGGGFSMGIISLLNTFYNGAVLGYACSLALDSFLVQHLLPHAIDAFSPAIVGEVLGIRSL